MIIGSRKLENVALYGGLEGTAIATKPKSHSFSSNSSHSVVYKAAKAFNFPEVSDRQKNIKQEGCSIVVSPKKKTKLSIVIDPRNSQSTHK